MDMPDIAGSVKSRVQFEFMAGLAVGRPGKQRKPDAGGMTAKDGKVRAGICYGRAQWHGPAGRGLKWVVDVYISIS
jgi:hypothetical protein